MLDIYRAVVTKVEDRNVVVKATHLQQCDFLVKPLFDGLIKESVPSVDDEVWVIDLHGTTTYRRYVPVDIEFNNLTDTPANTQIESATQVDIEAPTILLGVDAVEAAVKGDTLKTQLEDLITQIVSITVPTPVGFSGVPVNAAAINALSSLLVNILSGKTKVE